MGMIILSYCLHFRFRRRGCIIGKILPTAPYTLVDNINNIQISLARGGNTGLAEKNNKTFIQNSGCLAVIIRLLFKPPDAL